MPINSLEHPDYSKNISHWKKFRLTYEGGHDFIDTYLKQFSHREDAQDFRERKKITYNPAYAKAAVKDIQNAIYQRMVDINRIGGPKSYQNAILGQNGGVDRNGSTMNTFIGTQVLPELITMSKVGVYVDRGKLDSKATIRESNQIPPYLYIYRAESIKSWLFDSQQNLLAVLLEDVVDDLDEEYGLPSGTKTKYRLLQVTPSGVLVRIFDEEGEQESEEILQIKKIPFIIFEISQSLLEDVADYQIAALNLASSDMNYALKSNYPFYTEQYNPSSEIFARNALNTDFDQEDDADSVSNANVKLKDGTSEKANTANRDQMSTGSTHGRRYAKGLERPDFINPSSEPLRVSMEKQQKLKEETRELVGLNLASIQSRRASAESKKEDSRTKEEGLSSIGLVLEVGERKIARIWSLYEQTKEEVTVNYPLNYSLRTSEDRRAEATELTDIGIKINSKTYQKQIAERVIDLTIGIETSPEELNKIREELQTADMVFIDAESIRSDHEAGFVSTQTASALRGYAADKEIPQAKKDHAERLKRIQMAQGGEGGSARGIPDQSVNPKEEAKE